MEHMAFTLYYYYLTKINNLTVNPFYKCGGTLSSLHLISNINEFQHIKEAKNENFEHWDKYGICVYG